MMPTTHKIVLEDTLSINIGGREAKLAGVPIICHFGWEPGEEKYVVHDVWIAEFWGEHTPGASGAGIGNPRFKTIEGLDYKECKEITDLLSQDQLNAMLAAAPEPEDKE